MMADFFRPLVCLPLLLTVAIPSRVDAQSWSIGIEREVDEGHYLKLLAVESGWRLWRLETVHGISCSAIKSARGRPHPQPVGVGGGFYGGTPFLTVYLSGENEVRFGWQGAHLSGERTKYRRPNERFWTDWTYNSSLIDFDGQLLEVNIITYEYPEIYVGRAEETATMDLTGLGRMITLLGECR